MSIRESHHAVSVCIVCYLVVIPYWYPGELLVALKQIQIGTVSSQTLAVIVQSEDFAVWQRDASKAVSPAIVSVLVLVYVVAKVHHIVD